jgi:hypothetical protein
MTQSDEKQHDPISELMNDPERVRKIIQAAINQALLEHKRLGNPVCGSKNSQVCWVEPGDIPVNDVSQQPNEDS